ncbi:MAG: hypothetical protein E7J78_12615, partial [Pantoea sp.]|nr:hypothetical protein [Pantoea sp.]
MFSKKFTNKAAQPMEIEVIAAVNHEGIITRILASGGIAGSTDDQRAEAMRMFDWAKVTFVGQDITLLQSHNGVVPPNGVNITDFDFDSDPYACMAEVFGVPYKSVREQRMPEALGAAFTLDNMRFVVLDDINPDAIAEALLTTPGALDAILSGMHEE